MGINKKTQHLVVDAGALIKNAPIFEIGENVYTLPEIVKEIKDRQTRERLEASPYEFKFRDVPPEIIKIVTDFAKKTGDYPSLSANDIRLISLTYLLEKEFVGTQHIKAEPSQTVSSFNRPDNLYKPLVGFYRPKSTKKCKSSSTDDEHDTNRALQDSNQDMSEISDDASKSSDGADRGDDVNSDVCENTLESGDDEGVDSSNEEEDEDDEGWITPDNIKATKKQMEEMTLEDTSVVVACITTDFAMQNVLMQMGLHMMSADGMLIKQCRTFVLRCYACFNITTIMTKQFCPACGNRTLKKVAFSIAEDGSRILHLNFRRPLNIRGTKYSLPLPRGGKHAENPLLCEDQRIPQNRPPKSALLKVNALDPDYEARSSPFATNDVTSRAANLGIRVNRRQGDLNLNLKKKHTGRRRK